MPRRNLTAKTAEDMLKIITEGYDQALLFADFAAQQQLLGKTRTSPRYYRIEYFTDKPSRSIFTIQCNESEWLIKAPLVYLYNYDQLLDSCCAEIRAALHATRECVQCSKRCPQGAHFQLAGEHRIVCVSSGHAFSGLNAEGWGELRLLLAEEIKTLTGNNS